MKSLPQALAGVMGIAGFGWIMFDAWKHQRVLNNGASKTTRAEDPFLFWLMMLLYLFFFLAGVFELVSSFVRR